MYYPRYVAACVRRQNQGEKAAAPDRAVRSPGPAIEACRAITMQAVARERCSAVQSGL